MTAGGAISGSPSSGATSSPSKAGSTTSRPGAASSRSECRPGKARFSTWYELFPRSAGSPGKHGTFKEVERLLPGIAGMGFDVLYLPPIHPIGKTHRKGANNKPAAAGEPGSPWAIGSAEGGHKAVHPELGTLDDFRHLVQTAAEHGVDVALDIAF